MLYRDIPLALFNSTTIEDSRRAFEPASHHHVISQIGRLKHANAMALYEFNDTMPRFASSGFRLYYPASNIMDNIGNSLLLVEMGMEKKKWQADKGWLYKAKISIFISELDLVDVPNSMIGLIADLIKQASLCQHSATREEFWECEMEPTKDRDRID